MAVGNYLSYIEQYSRHWDGSKWNTYQMRPALYGGTVIVRGVSCPSRDWCVAVGTESLGGEGWAPEVQHWDGSKWSLDSLPWTITGNVDELTAISCASRSSCMAVGHRDGPATPPLVFQWDGTSWSLLSMSYPSGDEGVTLLGVSCTSSSWCMVTGYYHTPSGRQPIAEIWNGEKWSNVKNESPHSSEEGDVELEGVSCPDTNVCSVLSYSSKYTQEGKTSPVERWGGGEWTREPLSQPLGVELSEPLAISCPSTDFCAAVGQSPFG